MREEKRIAYEYLSLKRTHRQQQFGRNRGRIMIVEQDLLVFFRWINHLNEKKKAEADYLEYAKQFRLEDCMKKMEDMLMKTAKSVNL